MITPRPLLLVHGNQDEIVPVNDAYRPYAEAREPKQIIIAKGIGHQLRQNEWVMAKAIGWLQSHCQNYHSVFD